MMIFESVASLRPQPCGLPLRGWATQTDGFKAKRSEWQVATQNRTLDKQAPSYFHRLVVQEWGKAHTPHEAHGKIQSPNASSELYAENVWII